jgi:hypothetical protein
LHVARCTIEEHAPEYAIDVGVDRRNRFFVCERRHGSSCVWTNTRELDQLFRHVGQLAVVIPTDHARERVEIGGPGIIS